jgi:hypothetical protein
MPTKAATVKDYLAALPADDRRIVEAVRGVIRRNLDPVYEEGITYGMIGWYVPHRVHPAGYHCDPSQPVPFINLAARKGSVSLYFCGLYCGATDASGLTEAARRFRAAWEKTGKKLDMGKSCVRFSSLDQVPLEVIGQAVKRLPARVFLRNYLESLGPAARARPKSPKPGAAPTARTPKRAGASTRRAKPPGPAPKGARKAARTRP